MHSKEINELLVDRHLYDFNENTCLVVFTSTDFILPDPYYKFIKAKFNSIKYLKNKKKYKGEVLWLYKHNLYVFYIIVSDYLEDEIENIYVRKALTSFCSILKEKEISTIITSTSHMKYVLFDIEWVIKYLNEFLDDSISIHLYK